jgi:hypothetical protein
MTLTDKQRLDRIEQGEDQRDRDMYTLAMLLSPTHGGRRELVAVIQRYTPGRHQEAREAVSA